MLETPTPAQPVSPRQRSIFIDMLGSASREERDTGAWKLRLLGYDPVEFLCAELRVLPSVPQWKFTLGRKCRNVLRYGGELAIHLIVAIVISGIVALLTHSEPDPCLFWFGGGSSSSEMPVLDSEKRYRRRIGSILRGLAWQNNQQIIGPICERLHEADEDAQWRAQLTLKNLLPCIAVYDSNLLSSAQKAGLYRLLHSNDSMLVIAVLNALPHIGDGSALNEVKPLAFSADPGVRCAAQDALPAVCAFARREEESRTLLRGSAAPPPQPELLLRPAHAVPASNSSQMLRAAAGPETSPNQSQET